MLAATAANPFSINGFLSDATLNRHDRRKKYNKTLIKGG